MKKIKFLILSLIVVFIMSCDRDEYFPRCSECTIYEPYEAVLKCQIDFIPNGTLMQIWEGKLEDNILVYSTLIFNKFQSPVFEKTVPLNKQYTVTATYAIDNKTYIAIDSALPKVKKTQNQCDEPCYYVYNNTVNLRLKYAN